MRKKLKAPPESLSMPSLYLRSYRFYLTVPRKDPSWFYKLRFLANFNGNFLSKRRTEGLVRFVGVRPVSISDSVSHLVGFVSALLYLVFFLNVAFCSMWTQKNWFPEGEKKKKCFAPRRDDYTSRR